MRVLVIADGEHYAPVVRDALASLPHEVAGVWIAGGTEKLRGDEDYGVPVADDLDAAIAELEPEALVDLSDEPVLGPRERFRLASRALAHGLPYVGPDFRFDPPELAPFALPSLSVIGTGKRVGKTAVTGHLARLLARDRDVVVVAMGRGGPPEPEVAEVPPTVESLLELSRGGRHAASDYLETAALAGVVTVGCRRCGGGLAGSPGESNVLAGAALAAEREPELVIFDGSGAAIPPIDTDRRVLVTGSAQRDVATGYLNSYRILVSDLVILTGGLDEQLAHEIRQVKQVPVVPVELRPRPVTAVDGRRVAYFSTAPPEAHETIERHLREEHGAEVVLVSGNLARRDALRDELAQAGGAEVYLVEIKAAAIDVVAEAASERGAEVVFADNELVPVGVHDLDTELVTLADAALAREAVTP